jgi:[ribosomal protein S5]-alanine N-acetyltransferase
MMLLYEYKNLVLPLSTKRTFFLHIGPDSADCIFSLYKLPEVVQYTGEQPFHSKSQACVFIGSYKDYEVHGYGRYLVFLASTGAFCGFCGFRHFDETKVVDISFRFLPEYWGQGLATEVVFELIRFGFNEFGFPEIRAMVHAQNQRSIRVMQKAGFGLLDYFYWNRQLWLDFRIPNDHRSAHRYI